MGLELSPFSAYHRWQIRWNVISSNENFDPKAIKTNSERVHEAIKAIAEIGVIGGVQLTRIFLNNNKNLLKKMVNTKMIKRHMIKKNLQEIPVYTLGITGIEMTQSKRNQWLNYGELDVVRRLVFFQLYERMNNLAKGKIKIKRPDEFNSACIGIFETKEVSYHVIVLRENVNEAQKYILDRPDHRFLIVCEDLIYLEPLNKLLSKRNVRVTTDNELKKSPKNLFYMWFNNKWCKEREVMNEIQKERKAVNVN
ncbi:hypothetical protein [Calidifontibacillus erzurumensis]|uniref:hypothetical protein n=1 Tax=Calidifontibacillus erzurumensis TaxID=2741433 RepID=UPI0035B55A62